MRYRKIGTNDLWDFVSIAQNPNDPDRRLVILRPNQGEDIAIFMEKFQTEYELVTGTSSSSNEAIKETLNNIRQISNVRFVALPVFLTAFATMANYYTSDKLPWRKMPVVAWAGLWLAIVGVVFEIVLSYNLKCWWNALKKDSLVSSPSWKMIVVHRSKDWILQITRFTLFSPYVAMFCYWIYNLSLNWNWVITIGTGMVVFILAGVIWWLSEKI
jgi:hypothetical protein